MTKSRGYREPSEQRTDEESLVLTPKEVGNLLQLRPRQLQRLGVPCLDLGHKTKRYVKVDVLAWLDEQRRIRSRPSVAVDSKL